MPQYVMLNVAGKFIRVFPFLGVAIAGVYKVGILSA
jgi:hypothetical protein